MQLTKLLLVTFTLTSCIKAEDTYVAEMSNAEQKLKSLEDSILQLETKKDSLEKMVIGLDSLLYDNENFNDFLIKFVHDSVFSETRIIRPLLYETRTSPLTDRLIIQAQTLAQERWKPFYRLLKGQDATNTDVYDNFELQGNLTNERVLHKYGLEQCGDIRYFFKGFEGKWKLVKVQQIGS